MFKITKIAFLLMLAAIAALGSVSCTKSELDNSASIAEDQPATLMLNIDGGKFSSVATRAAQNESEIHSLALFVFNQGGKLITRSFFDDTQISQIKVKTLSGNDMRVVAIANFKGIEGLEEQLATAANYDVLTDVVVTNSATSPGNSAGILMTGETVADITDSPSGTSVAIAMQYAVAKVTLSIKVNSAALSTGEEIEIFGLSLGSIPTNGFLIPKKGEPTERTFNESTPIEYSGNQNDGITATFYILENLRGGRKQIAAPEGLLENSTNGHLFKRHYAPDNASHAVISANYRKAGNRNKRVDMYIYFGHNNSNNYDLARSENHTYTIKINGLNNLNIDTNIETTESSLDFNYGDNLNFDAHADNRNVSFAQASGAIDVQVIDNNGRRFSDPGFDATWVKVSPLDLMKHQVRSQKGGGSKGEWQQMGNRGEIVRGKYIPHHSWREKHPEGGWNAIPAGTENDDQLSFADATYRMCYAITDITLNEAREINIYADENLTGMERHAKIEVRYRDQSGAEHVETMPISQAALHNMGSSGGYELLMESFEEYSFNIYSSPAKQLTKASGMRWGFFNNVIYNGAEASGNFLTANAVYGTRDNLWARNNASFVQRDADGNPTWSSSIVYRTKYGSVEPTYDWDYSSTPIAPYYYPDYNSSQQTYAPIYNSAAARYCHEKNRDLNGDGQISPDEANWYLPSKTEMMVIAENSSKLPASAKFETVFGSNYWTSTETRENLVYAYDYRSMHAIDIKKTITCRVRCIRQGKQAEKETVYLDPDNSIVVDNTGLQPDQITTTPKPSFPASETSNKTISSRFLVGRDDVVRSSSWTNAAGMSDHFLSLQLGDNLWSDKQSGCVIYSELPDHSDKGKWRLPTKSELERIAELLPKLEKTKGFIPMSNKWYWSATEIAGYGVYNSWAVNPRTKDAQNFSRSTPNYARCIKQL